MALNLRRLTFILLTLVLALLLTGCEALSSPQNTFAPAGEVAEDQKFYFIFVAVPAAVIGLLVMLACLMIPIMFRRGAGDPGLPKQVHGNTALELSWTIIPAILMAVIGVVTVAGIRDLGRRPSDDALRVNVTGQRFSWLFDYPNIQDSDGQALGSPINELRIPVDREIGFYINSVDVIHSFWVPKLAGKIDAVPNHENYLWVKADRPGTYAGQCAEFCGLQHADMRMTIIAMEQDEFDAWVQEQGDYEEIAPPADEDEDEPVDEQEGGDDEEDEPVDEQGADQGESARAQGD